MLYKEEDLENKTVFVNGKRIAADIKAANTKEGWVDILLPSFNKTQTILATDSKFQDKNIPTFQYVVKRLQGQVEVRDRK